MGVVSDVEQYWMQQALALADQAKSQGEVPVGALIVKDNQLISSGYNQPITQCDPSAHAEIIALRAAAKQLGNYRLLGAELYVTLEPCAMCAGAMIHARIERVIIAAADPKTGAAGSVFNLLNHPDLNHQVAVTMGVMQAESAQLLRDFFRARRG